MSTQVRLLISGWILTTSDDSLARKMDEKGFARINGGEKIGFRIPHGCLRFQRARKPKPEYPEIPRPSWSQIRLNRW